MRPVRSYVVRIYKQGYSNLWGTAEDSSSGGKGSFSSIEDLWLLLTRRIPAQPVTHSLDKSRANTKRREGHDRDS
jgi:hypothetical protein